MSWDIIYHFGSSPQRLSRVFVIPSSAFSRASTLTFQQHHTSRCLLLRESNLQRYAGATAFIGHHAKARATVILRHPAQ